MRIAVVVLLVIVAAVPAVAATRAERIAEVNSAIQYKLQSIQQLEQERAKCESDRTEVLRHRERLQNESYAASARIDSLRLELDRAQSELEHADRLYGYYQSDARWETERRICQLKERIERINDAISNIRYRCSDLDGKVSEAERRANDLQSRAYEKLCEIDRVKADVERLKTELYNLEHP